MLYRIFLATESCTCLHMQVLSYFRGLCDWIVMFHPFASIYGSFTCVLPVPRPMALRQKSLAWESRCLKEMHCMLAFILRKGRRLLTVLDRDSSVVFTRVEQSGCNLCLIETETSAGTTQKGPWMLHDLMCYWQAWCRGGGGRRTSRIWLREGHIKWWKHVKWIYVICVQLCGNIP